jgi:hypothetical protein
MELQSLKSLKELILANLLSGSLTIHDLNALSDLYSTVKQAGVDILVKLPEGEEPKCAPSYHSEYYAKRFLGVGSEVADINNLGLKLDLFFADTTVPRQEDCKIKLIKLARELVGLGLADAKWLIEDAYGL